MREILLKEDVLHADETTLEVLRDPGRKAQSKSYMWIFQTGKDAKQKLILYDYQEIRKASENFSQRFQWISALVRLFRISQSLYPDIWAIDCLAHIRRNFTDAVGAIRNEEKRSASPAMIGIAYFDKLFEIGRNIAVLLPDERKLKRQELSLPVLNELRNWIAKNYPCYLTLITCQIEKKHGVTTPE